MSEPMELDKPDNKPADIPWLEKHRPQTFEEIAGNNETIERFLIFAKEGNTPNMILAGPPGCGKTTTILALARILLGSLYKDAVLELNASNERGLDVVRNRIKTFAQQKLSLPVGCQKFVILDEADSMTEGAQQALRRTMEIYSNTTRFMLACNRSEKIIAPIQSRCCVMRFMKLQDGQILQRLKFICEKENVEYNDEGMNALLFTSEGDMRQAIVNLQSAHESYGFVNSENVYKVTDNPHPNFVIDLFKSIQTRKLRDSINVIDYLLGSGYAGQDILKTVMKVAKTLTLDEGFKIEIYRVVARHSARMVEIGNFNQIQLTWMICDIWGLYHKQKQ